MDDKALETYRTLLAEIKLRVEALDSVLTGHLRLRGKIAEELCYLQLRMICELIAIGCLILHGNLKPKAALFKTYKADWLMGELEKLHPKFFPTALENQDPLIGGIFDLDGAKKKSGFLTRIELQNLWREAGGKLHRGSAKNILKNDPPLQIQRVRQWRDKIVGLLNRHMAKTRDEEVLCVFSMDDGAGAVCSWTMSRLPDKPAKIVPQTKRVARPSRRKKD